MKNSTIVKALFFSLLLSGCNNPKEPKVSDIYDIQNSSPRIILNNDSGPFSSANFFSKLEREHLRKNYERGDIAASYGYALALFQGDYYNKNKEKGLGILIDLWKKGVVDVGISLYTIYHGGIGVAKNDDVALAYLKRSAQAGYTQAQLKLGYIYGGHEANGIVDIDKGKSLQWFLQAAKNGDKKAAINAAEIYRKGIGVLPDYDRAFYWINKVPKLPYGHAIDGYSYLGYYYENGIGTKIDLVLAYVYYSLVQPSEADNLNNVIDKMKPEELSLAQKKLNDWKYKNNINTF